MPTPLGVQQVSEDMSPPGEKRTRADTEERCECKWMVLVLAMVLVLMLALLLGLVRWHMVLLLIGRCKGWCWC